MLIDRKVGVVAKAVLVAGSLSLCASVPALAFPKIGLPQAVQQIRDGEKTQSVTSLATSGAQHASRSPLIVDIGARTQLFDGDFLCEISDQKANLYATSPQF